MQTHLFNWQTETWSRGPDMAAARWYPAVQALGNNEAVIVGGGPAVPEVYQTDKTLRKLSNASGYSDRFYAFLTTRPNGQVELMGPVTQMNTIDTSGTGAIAATKSAGQHQPHLRRLRHLRHRQGAGGCGGRATLPRAAKRTFRPRRAYIVDVNGTSTTAPNTTVTQTSSMSVGRRQHSLTILADGSVLATGGMSKATNANADLNNPVFAAERWDPKTGNWTVLSSASRVRQYHSSATLLPDGRVLTGGGGVCASCVSAGYLRRTSSISSRPICTKGRQRAEGQQASDRQCACHRYLRSRFRRSTPDRLHRSPKLGWYASARQRTAKIKDSGTYR